ncbi:MAG: hypothetical protein ACKOOF_06275 [Planctomycetaceae bacterium]
MNALTWSVAVMVLALAGGATAADAETATDAWGIDAGFAGVYRAGSWTPVVVSPHDPETATVGDTIHVWAEDADGQFVRSPPAALAAVPGRETLAARVCLRVGRPTGRVLIERMTSGGTTTVEQSLPAPLPATQRVLLVLGDVPAARRAARLLGADEATRMQAVEISDAATRGRLAAAAAGRDFDAADAIVVCGRDVALLPADVIAGIDAWVRDGGRLVVAAGASARTVEQGGGPAADWLPGRIERLVPLRRLAALEAYARAGGLASRPTPTQLEVPLFADPGRLDGVVDVFDGAAATDLPLVVRKSHGLGTITWLGCDLDAEPFRGWPGADALLVRLLGERPSAGDDDRMATAGGGPPDLAAQLRIAVESSGHGGRIGPVPFEAIIGLGLLYVACLYPLDWWLVSRGRRPGLAWVTLPLIVAAFTAAAAACAHSWQSREPLTGHAAEIVDVDADSGHVRGTSWAAAWRRENGGIDASLPSGSAAVSWWADAGTGFGAIDAAIPHPSLAAADYRYGETLAGLEDVPVAATADRLFEAAWTAASGTAPLVTSTLARDAQGALAGSIAHHLPFPLDACRLASAGWIYDLGRLAPAAVHDLRQGRGPRSLAGVLARREAAREREIAPRWNPAESDVLRILEVAGFHAAAGGVAYTGLPAGRLARLDLSPLLAVDRAVLFGTASDPPPEWTADWRIRDAGAGGTAAAAVKMAGRLYRIVIPLAAAGDAAR